jgi:hypothetical protein
MSSAVQPQPLLSLFDSGITDFVSVIPPGATLGRTRISPSQLGKVPGTRHWDGSWGGSRGWQKAPPPSRADLERIVATGASIGLRSRSFPGIDCDVENDVYAAELRELITEILGATSPYRVGRPPKFLIPCNTTAPFQKRKIRLTTADGSDAGAIEFLADGQQYLVAGIHPNTGKPYAWHHGEQHGGIEVLAEYVQRAQLPELTAEMIDQQLIPAITRWAERHGILAQTSAAQERGPRKRPQTAERTADQEALRAPSIDALREAMALIPNDERDWDRYVRFAAAIRAAAGPDREAEGFAIFAEWAARYSAGPRDAALNFDTWASLNPPHALGWGFIADHARAYGFNDAQWDFEVVDGAAPPTQIKALSTEGERIAALLQDAARPFFRELPTLKDGRLLQRWRELDAATRHGDPLLAVFEADVIGRATHVRASLNDERRFTRLLRGELTQTSKSTAWHTCSSEDQELLLRAAFTLLSEHGTLANRIGASPGAPLALVEHSSTDDLIQGWLPRRGLGAIVSPPGQGKTHAAVALGVSVARPPHENGVPQTFANQPVRHGAVLYLAGEDGGGVAGRAARAAQQRGLSLEHFYVFAKGPPLSSPSDSVSFVLEALTQLPKNAPPVALIIIDTFRASFVGEENSSGDVSTATTTATALGRMLDAAVVLVHHATKSDPTDPRGSSAFLASLDFMMVMNEKKDDRVSMTVTKVKNGPAGQSFTWTLVDGVLHDGCHQAFAPSEGEEAWALAAAEGIRAVAGSGAPVARKVLVDQMVAANPSYFDKDYVKDSTARSRVARGINRALERGWLSQVRKGSVDRYLPGPELPPLPSPNDFDLNAVA